MIKYMCCVDQLQLNRMLTTVSAFYVQYDILCHILVICGNGYGYPTTSENVQTAEEIPTFQDCDGSMKFV